MVGEILDAYPESQDRLWRTTPEGEAFDGAFELLRDAELTNELHEHIQVLARPPGRRRAGDRVT
ncbi:DUF3375 family protein [Catenulispora rubra]|uniref:DUF3375 family protein n=1 Tax=Catenulispora rubra TaxID=280293 RepID=UPI00189279B1